MLSYQVSRKLTPLVGQVHPIPDQEGQDEPKRCGFEWPPSWDVQQIPNTWYLQLTITQHISHNIINARELLMQHKTDN